MVGYQQVGFQHKVVMTCGHTRSRVPRQVLFCARVDENAIHWRLKVLRAFRIWCSESTSVPWLSRGFGEIGVA